MVSEKEIYNLVDLVVLKIRNIDLPRKVRFRNTSKNRASYKIDKNCLNGRKYSDYVMFTKENSDINIVEMDTVEGIKAVKFYLQFIL